MKIKIDCRKASEVERSLISSNDMYRYNIERFKRMTVVSKYAEIAGMKEISWKDFEVISIE